MDGTKFTLDVSSGGALKLKEIVKEKLSEYIGNYTDDVLVEYVVVLVGHGKEKSQAVKNLEAFLGSDSESFVTWLWEHMSTNKHLYVEPEEGNHSTVPPIEDTLPQVEPSLRSVVAVVEYGEDTTIQMEAEEQAEDPGTAGLGKSVDKGDRPEDGSHAGVENDHHSRRRGRRREFSRHNNSKRSRSPEIWTRRGRGRADRPDVKEMSPPVVKASRRLLITAVREVVNESALLATKKDALRRTESAKRLQSVVSSDPDAQEIGGPEIEMSHADGPLAVSDPLLVEEPPITKTSGSQEGRLQERLPSVWDRLALTNQSSLSAEEALDIDDEGTRVEGGPILGHPMNRGKWKKNSGSGHGTGPGNVRNSRGNKFNSALQRSGRKFEVNGHILGDALRRVNLEQMQNQDTMYRHHDVVSSKQPGLYSGHESAEGFEDGDDAQPVFKTEDVLEMKKRLRQVQLDMTKLRARQAEVTKEVQRTPVSGIKPLLSPTQPSQEDINARSIFVSNVHFAATQAAIRVHFGRCGNINRVMLLVEAGTGKPRGSAYVEFASRDAVENALTLNESSLLSRSIKVMRKDDAVAELITPPVLLTNPWPHPLIPRPYARDHAPPRSMYSVRRPNIMAHSGASNLKWKRGGASPTANMNDVVPLTNGERNNSGPIRLSRSLSYVRVAPYAIQGMAAPVIKS